MFENITEKHKEGDKRIKILETAKHNLGHIADLSKTLSETPSEDKDSKAPGEKGPRVKPTHTLGPFLLKLK